MDPTRRNPLTITEFLAQLGMPQLAPVFTRERITPDMLPYIHDATLLQLGVTSVGDLVRIFFRGNERAACARHASCDKCVQTLPPCPQVRLRRAAL